MTASYVRMDGTAVLSMADLVLVLDALQLASRATDDLKRAAAWRGLGYRLGDDR